MEEDEGKGSGDRDSSDGNGGKFVRATPAAGCGKSARVFPSGGGGKLGRAPSGDKGCNLSSCVVGFCDSVFWGVDNCGRRLCSSGLNSSNWTFCCPGSTFGDLGQYCTPAQTSPWSPTAAKILNPVG